MKIARRPTASLAAALAGALLILPGIACADSVPAPSPPCLTSAEFTALASYTLPSIITGVAQRCAASLPPDAFLRTGAGALADRYAQVRPTAWPGARAALLKLGAGGGDIVDVIKNLPDATQQQLVDTLIAGAVAQKLPLARCTPVDQVLHLLSPLPPQSAAELIGLAVGLGTRMGERHIGTFALCPG